MERVRAVEAPAAAGAGEESADSVDEAAWAVPAAVSESSVSARAVVRERRTIRESRAP